MYNKLFHFNEYRLAKNHSRTSIEYVSLQTIFSVEPKRSKEGYLFITWNTILWEDVNMKMCRINQWGHHQYLVDVWNVFCFHNLFHLIRNTRKIKINQSIEQRKRMYVRILLMVSDANLWNQRCTKLGLQLYKQIQTEIIQNQQVSCSTKIQGWTKLIEHFSLSTCLNI